MKKKNYIYFLLLLILIITAFLRLYHITTVPPGLYPDEAINGNDALQTMRTGAYNVFYPENNGREGLFVNIQALLFKYVYGAPTRVSANGAWIPEPWMLRLPAAIFGILTVLGVFLFAQELFPGSSSIALFSTFLIATSFWHINFSRIGFRDIAAPFFLIWALFFLLLALRDSELFSRRDKFLVAASGILFGLGFYTYIAYRIIPLLFLLFVPFYKNKKNFWKIALIFIVAAVIVALPIGVYFLKHPADFLGRTSEISVSNSSTPLRDLSINTLKTAAMFNFRGDSNWRQNYNSEPELFWPVGILFLLGIFLGIGKIIKDKKSRILNFEFALLFLWLVLALLPVVLSNEGIPHALRSILAIPPAFVLAGVGGVWLYDFLKKYVKSFWLPLASFIFLSLLVFQAYYTYFILWAENSNTAGAFNADYVVLGDKLNQISSNVPKYVVVEAGGVLVSGIPMPAQTVMFVTDTFTSEEQAIKNIHYLLPEQENAIPAGAQVFYIQ